MADAIRTLPGAFGDNKARHGDWARRISSQRCHRDIGHERRRRHDREQVCSTIVENLADSIAMIVK